MTTIRRATLADLRPLAEAGLPVYLSATAHANAPARPDEFVDMLQRYVSDPTTLVLVAERDGKLVGAIGGELRPAVFYTTTHFFFVAFWVVAPQQGWLAIRLLKTALTTAHTYAPLSTVSFLHGWTDARLPKLLKRLGFQPAETVYIRSV